MIKDYLLEIINKFIKEFDDMMKEYTVVGVPSQSDAVLNLRREAIYERK